jgi:hypothetical protein
MLKEENFFTRHSIKPKGDESEEYKGISDSGVELARERAREILLMLESMNDGAIMFIGGASKAVRTKSTARVYGDELGKIATESGMSDIIVITEKDLIDESKDVNKIMEIINNNKEKKILIDYPLFLKEFGMSHWLNNDGDLSDFTKELLKKNENNEMACVSDWFKSEGAIGDLRGPNPTEVAKDHLRGIERLRLFAEKLIKDRQISIGFVGHSWNLDALATYLGNNGDVTTEGFQKIGGKMIGETQAGKIEITEDGAKFIYAGNKYDISR